MTPAYTENPDYYDALCLELVRSTIRLRTERGDPRIEALLVRAMSAIVHLTRDLAQQVPPAVEST